MQRITLQLIGRTMDIPLPDPLWALWWYGIIMLALSVAAAVVGGWWKVAMMVMLFGPGVVALLVR